MSETVKLYGINQLRETLVVAETTRRSMQSNRSRDTKPEIALRKALWHNGMRGYRKNVRKYKGTPDIVFTKSKLAIFVHGCFWHGHECGKARLPKLNREFWSEKISRNKVRHEANIKQLESQGFAVITVWECDLENGMDEIIRQIQGLLEKT